MPYKRKTARLGESGQFKLEGAGRLEGPSFRAETAEFQTPEI